MTYLGKKWYDAAERFGVEIRVGHTVSIAMEDQKEQIGAIEHLWEDEFGVAWASVRWFVNPGETK